MTLKAIIFDVDGTLAETEELHRHAFNRAFAEAGHDWSWSPDLYRRLLKVAGGRERIRHYLDLIGAELPDTEIVAMHSRKNALYASSVEAGDAALRPGVARLIAEAEHANVKLAIATTTSGSNLSALLSRLLGSVRFDAIVTGEDVRAKKPAPEAYHRALERLGLPASACVAIEDSRNGLDAALAAGITVVVTPAFYTDHEEFDGASRLSANLDGIRLADLEGLACAPALAS